MFAISRTALSAIFAMGMCLVLAPTDGQCAGASSESTRAPVRAPEMDQAAEQPSRTITRKGAEPVLKLNKDTVRNLRKLKDTQRIQVGKKEMTVREFKKTRMDEQKKGLAKVQAMRAGSPTQIGELQAAFDKAEESRLKAANAKVMAEMAKIKKAGMEPLDKPGPARAAPTNGNGASQAIKREAAEIQNRMRGGTATPADEKRAKELYDQYQQQLR